MERKKPKLLIIGHARHGKDTVADLIANLMELSFVSSSEFVGRRAIWPMWGEERYCSFDEMFEDRVNFRSVWHNLIAAYNTPDKSRTATEMLKDHSIYVGMRAIDELQACNKKKLFDHIIWVEASERHPLEGKDSNQMTADLADIYIENNGPERNLIPVIANLQKQLHKEGYDVALDRIPPRFDEDAYDDSQEEYKAIPSTDEDPCDPPVQKPLIKSDILDPKYTAVEDTSLAVGTQAMEKRSAEKMIVNPTLEESRKFHNDALMAQFSKPSKPLELPKTLPTWKAPFISNAVPQSNCDTHNPPTPYTPGERQAVAERPQTWEDMPDDATQVLDHGFFKVLEIMGSDSTICESARMSYGRGTKKVNDDQGLINYLVRNGHTSPLEMGEIRFHMRMPIFVMRQWVRHRTANLNEYSGRYSEMVELFYVPKNEQICLQNKVNKQGSAEPLLIGAANMVQKTIQDTGKACFSQYRTMLEMGVSRETARMVLPLNTYTEVVWKLDISNLLKFLVLRDDDHAQWEIRQYAIHVAQAVQKNFPLVFHAYLERRQSQTFTMDEVRALVTGDPDNLSISQKRKMVLTRYNIFN